MQIEVARSPVPTIDPAAHIECLEFIRAAIASNDQQTVLDIKNVLAEVCDFGYADRTQIWVELTPIEQQQFQSLLAPPPLAREAGQENLRGDRLPVPCCRLRHRERVERGDQRWPAYSRRCCGGCWRSAISRF